MKWLLPTRWLNALLLALVAFYRYFVSPSLGSSCRFEPSCSAYAQQALRQHGALAGGYLATRRVLRCSPWCEGGHDPVPSSAGWFSFKGFRR